MEYIIKEEKKEADATVRDHGPENVARIAHAPLGITHVDDIYWIGPHLVTPLIASQAFDSFYFPPHFLKN